MKKPYIKKFSEISGFTVWLVDGKYVRDNMNVDFTNYGQHYLFDFIPEDEFWIDEEEVPGEEKFYSDSMLAMNQLLKNKILHAEAVKMADEAEKKDRMEIYKNESNIEKAKKNLRKTLLKKYSKKIKVWLVNGRTVRDLFFIDFTEGGHGYVYNFIPKNEVWVDDDMSVREFKPVLVHELHERKLMIKDMAYEPAHKRANERELYCRTHPKEVDKILKEEIEENNKNA